MNKCVMCKEPIDIEKDDYECDFDAELWCMSCAMQESDTGDVF